MEHEILYRPSYSLLKVKLAAGESLVAESGAMVSMSDGIEIQTSMKGGMLGALKRKVLGGESMFMNTFTAAQGGEITLAPSMPGDVAAVAMQGRTLFAQSGSYLASSPEIEIDTKWGGAKTFFSREGFFLLKLSGVGTLYLSSYGAIHDIELAPGQKYVVDTGHMVSFDETVQYNVKRVGGLKSTLLSGEGLVCELAGPGKISIQSRSLDSFISWLAPRLPHSGS